MYDIFSEVDNDIRQEKYNRLWKRFAPLVIGVAVLIVASTAGYRGWLYWQEQQSQEAADIFLNAVEQSEAGNYDEAMSLFEDLSDAIGGYGDLATLRGTADLAKSGDVQAAIDQFDAMSRDTSVTEALRDVAAMRAAYLAIDTQTYSDIADRIERLTADGNSLRSVSRELLALSAWKNGDISTARGWLAALENDSETPQDVARRAGLINELISAQEPASDSNSASEDEGSAQ